MLSRARLHSNIHGRLQPDRRLQGAPRQLRASTKHRACAVYLARLYCRLGETLPHKFHGKWQKRKARRYKVLPGLDDDSNSCSSNSESQPQQQEQLSKEAREDVLADSTHFTQWVDTGLGKHICRLPSRYLPPATVQHICWDFQAQLAEGTDISYETFLKAFIEFKSILRFRQPGDFADCDECQALKQLIQEAKKEGLAQLMDATRALQEHYDNASASRDLEEAMRCTTLDASKPVLCIMTDGMGQAHWSIPRLPGLRGPKKFSDSKGEAATVQGAGLLDLPPWHTFHHCRPHHATRLQLHMQSAGTGIGSCTADCRQARHPHAQGDGLVVRQHTKGEQEHHSA